MFSDNELRSKRLCFFPLASPFISPCGMPLSATEMSEKSVWVGRFVNLAVSLWNNCPARSHFMFLHSLEHRVSSPLCGGDSASLMALGSGDAQWLGDGSGTVGDEPF